MIIIILTVKMDFKCLLESLTIFPPFYMSFEKPNGVIGVILLKSNSVMVITSLPRYDIITTTLYSYSITVTKWAVRGIYGNYTLYTIIEGDACPVKDG